MAKDNSSGSDKLISFFDDPQNHRRIRKALIIYFSRELRSTAQDHEECADETIFRVFKKIDEGIEITNEIGTDGIEKYTFGVARLVKMEFWRKPRPISIEDDSTIAGSDNNDPLNKLIEILNQDEILSCYRKCLSEFTGTEQDFYDKYYNPPPGAKPKEARKNLEITLRVSNNALRKRALRLRERLEDCLKKCLAPDGTKLKKPHI